MPNAIEANCDVFISYSQEDENFPAEWISAFHERLKAALRGYPGLSAVIFRDVTSLARDQDFAAQIHGGLNKAHVLLCVVSPNYTASLFCRKELNYFVKRPLPGSLVCVGKRPVEPRVLPRELQKLSGYKFYGDNGYELAAFVAVDAERKPSPRFEDAIAPLAGHIAAKVEAARAPRQRVLLLASSDRDLERRRLGNELRRIGIEVVSHEELAGVDLRQLATSERLGSPQSRAAHELDPDGPDLIVLLLGQVHSAAVAEVYAALAEVAKKPEFRDSGRRCLAMVPPEQQSQGDAALVDAAQAALVRKMKSDEAPKMLVPVEQADLALTETRRYLEQLQREANRVPTIYFHYVTRNDPKVVGVRAELRRLNSALTPGQPLRLVDLHGDGDCPLPAMQTLARAPILKSAHVLLIFMEDAEGISLWSALSEIRSDAGTASRPIGVYSLDPNLPVLDEFLSEPNLHVIVPSSGPPPGLSPNAKTLTLEQFLAMARAEASRP